MFFNNFNYIVLPYWKRTFFLSPSKKKTTSPCFFFTPGSPGLGVLFVFSPTFPKCKNIGSMWLVYAPYISLTFMVHTLIKYTSTWKLSDQKHTKGLKRLYVNIKTYMIHVWDLLFTLKDSEAYLVNMYIYIYICRCTTTSYYFAITSPVNMRINESST